MKLALYTRISLDPTGSSEAPQRQADACIQWAERNGHEIVAVYEDRDISGYNKKVTRPGFEAMLAAGHEGILCWRIDRLLRNWKDWARLDDLLDSGVVVLTEDGTDSRRDSAILAIKVTFAKEESRRTSERLKAKNAARAKDGLPWKSGWRCFGYTRDFEVVPEEAKEIRRAVSELLSGQPLIPISVRWNAGGITTTVGNRWTPSVVRTMLKGPHLAGLRRVGKGFIRGAWEPIISEEEHRALLVMWESRKRTAPLRKHWTSGLAYCAECGEKMGANRGSYRCPSGHVTIRIEHIERAAEDILRKAAARVKVDPPPVGDYAAEIAELQQRRDALDVSHWTTRIPDGETYLQIRATLTERLAELQKRTAVVAVLPDFDSEWPALSLQEKAGYARSFIESVAVSPPGRGKKNYSPRWFDFRMLRGGVESSAHTG